MSSIHTPSSLKWLLDKRARLLGEINKLENSRDKKLENARKRALEAENSLEQARQQLACLESSAPMIIESLRGDLQAVDNTLGLHEIQITQIDKFQTLAWCNYIVDVKGACTSYHLEQTIREIDSETKEELFVARCLWDEYKSGVVSTTIEYLPSGKPGAVLLAESHIPMSGEIYRHLLWQVMRTSHMRSNEAVEALESFKLEIANHYFDPRERDARRKRISLGQNLWRPATVKLGNFYGAMDHLAVNQMFLRLDVWSYESDLNEIALNISNTLKILAASPWNGPFHEEMYDWLGQNVWNDFLDSHICPCNPFIHGWRKYLLEQKSTQRG